MFKSRNIAFTEEQALLKVDENSEKSFQDIFLGYISSLIEGRTRFVTCSTLQVAAGQHFLHSPQLQVRWITTGPPPLPQQNEAK